MVDACSQSPAGASGESTLTDQLVIRDGRVPAKVIISHDPLQAIGTTSGRFHYSGNNMAELTPLVSGIYDYLEESSKMLTLDI